MSISNRRCDDFKMREEDEFGVKSVEASFVSISSGENSLILMWNVRLHRRIVVSGVCVNDILCVEAGLHTCRVAPD